MNQAKQFDLKRDYFRLWKTITKMTHGQLGHVVPKRDITRKTFWLRAQERNAVLALLCTDKVLELTSVGGIKVGYAKIAFKLLKAADGVVYAGSGNATGVRDKIHAHVKDPETRDTWERFFSDISGS